MKAVPTPDGGRDERLEEALEACLEAVETGRSAELCAALARSPDLAGDMAEFLAAHARAEKVTEPLRSVTAGLTEDFAAGPPAPPPDVGPGPFGDYEILGELGAGGMAVVYRARQRSPRRDVALKMLRGGSPASHEALRRDAEALAKLDHLIAALKKRGIHVALELQSNRRFRDDDGVDLAGLRSRWTMCLSWAYWTAPASFLSTRAAS